jgi:hypothetical protein
MKGPPGKEGGLLEEQATKSNELPQGCHNFVERQACVHGMSDKVHICARIATQ